VLALLAADEAAVVVALFPVARHAGVALLEVRPALHRRHADPGLEHRTRRVAAHAVLAPEAARRQARLLVVEGAAVGVGLVLGVDRGVAAGAGDAGHHAPGVRGRAEVGDLDVARPRGRATPGRPVPAAPRERGEQDEGGGGEAWSVRLRGSGASTASGER